MPTVAKKYKCLHRVQGINFDERKKESSVHEAGAIVTLDPDADATKALIQAGAIKHVAGDDDDA